MNIIVELQNNSSFTSNFPSKNDFEIWIKTTLNHFEPEDHELTIRIMDEAEIQALNKTYRQKDKPTNVLSFPFDPPPGQDTNYLGDIAICAPVIFKEAEEQNKSPQAHWAHLTIHGVLHLLGYDHINDQEAEDMEALEIMILSELGLDNPY